jgi:hypothetical protein
MLRLLGRITLGLCALSLQACGDEPLNAPLGGAGAAGGAAGASPAGSAGMAVGGSGAGSGGQAGAGGSVAPPAMACSSYSDDATWSLRVTIKNEMTQTLYLGQQEMSCQLERLFQVEDGARQVLPALDGCHTSCETMMKNGAPSCPSVCATPATITLEPGQTLQVPWDGRFGVDFTLPQQCVVGAMPSSLACVRAKRIEASLFTFSARAGTRRTCLDPSGSCTCAPNPTGGCSAPSSLIAGTIITTELILKLEPGEAATNGDPPYIGLVFNDQ